MNLDTRPVYRRQDLSRFIEPRSIAIVGASPTEGHAASTLRNLANFKGKVYLVNGKYEQIGDRPCYPSVMALPEVPDAVVVAIGRGGVERVVEECAEKKVGGVAIYAAGYGETGRAEDKAAQARLTAIARAGGIRIVGPNVVGVVNHIDKAAMSFVSDLALSDQRGPSIGIVCQSGGISNALTQSIHVGVRVTHTLSAGNSCDVDCVDWLAYLAESPDCRAIAMVIEGLNSIERLMEAGEILGESGKPLIVCKFGRSIAGSKAAMSHTGFLAGSDAAYTAAFRRMNAIQVDNYHALIETAVMMAKSPSPKGRGIMVLTSSGGTAVYAADVAERKGVVLPQPSDALKAELRKHIPEFGTFANPCDITAVAPVTERLVLCADEVLQDPTYAAVLMPNVYLTESERVRIKGMADAAAQHGKLLAMTVMSEWLAGPGVRDAHGHPNAVVFRDTETCLSALTEWMQRSERIERGKQNRNSRISDPGAKEKAAALIRACTNRTLTEREAKQVLATYGVPIVEERLIHSVDEAVDAARHLGLPVVMKLESPDIPHKTEAGVIRLNLKSEAEVRLAYDEIMGNAGKLSPVPRIHGILVQPMIPSGTEILIGGTQDLQFGPVIVVGLGGVLVELLGDTIADLAPVSPGAALQLLGSLRSQKVLDGFRGLDSIDRPRLADVIARLSEFLVDQAELISELDVNPLICTGSRVVAVDALIVKSGR